MDLLNIKWIGLAKDMNRWRALVNSCECMYVYIYTYVYIHVYVCVFYCRTDSEKYMLRDNIGRAK
jgi:hypothetical protein